MAAGPRACQASARAPLRSFPGRGLCAALGSEVAPFWRDLVQVSPPRAAFAVGYAPDLPCHSEGRGGWVGCTAEESPAVWSALLLLGIPRPLRGLRNDRGVWVAGSVRAASLRLCASAFNGRVGGSEPPQRGRAQQAAPLSSLSLRTPAFSPRAGGLAPLLPLRLCVFPVDRCGYRTRWVAGSARAGSLASSRLRLGGATASTRLPVTCRHFCSSSSSRMRRRMPRGLSPTARLCSFSSRSLSCSNFRCRRCS